MSMVHVMIYVGMGYYYSRSAMMEILSMAMAVTKTVEFRKDTFVIMSQIKLISCL